MTRVALLALLLGMVAFTAGCPPAPETPGVDTADPYQRESEKPAEEPPLEEQPLDREPAEQEPAGEGPFDAEPPSIDFPTIPEAVEEDTTPEP